MTLAEELQRRGCLPLEMKGKRLVFFGVLPQDAISRTEQAYLLYKSGLSQYEIAAQMKISRSCVREYIQREERKLVRWL